MRPPWRWALPAMAASSVLGWFFYISLFRATWGQDWMVFDTAGRAWLHGDLALLLNGARFTSVLNAEHGVRLVFHPWVYPPATLLLALPFALLPWWPSYVLFQAIGLAALVAALRLVGGTRWRALAAGVLASGAAAFCLGAGQSGFLSAALVTAGTWLMARRPGVAGVLLGLMVFKPQLALLLPVALLAARAWRAMGAAALTVAAVLSASLLLPGAWLWRAWLRLFLEGDPAYGAWVAQGRLYGQSVFACARLAGLSAGAAAAAQVVAAAAAAACVAVAFRHADPMRRLAVLLVATVLAAPHVGTYDAVMMAEGAMMLLQPDRHAPARAEAALAVAVWCTLSFQPPFVLRPAVVTPLLVLALLVRAIAPQRGPAPASHGVL